MASYLSAVAAVRKPLKDLTTAVVQACLVSQPIACRRLSTPMSDDDVLSFCSSLSEDLRALERLLGEGSVSLKWSAEAMRMLKKTQMELVALFRKFRPPTSLEAEENWFRRYMEETAVLLDLCNHLRSVTSGISRYRMLVDLAIHKVERGSTTEFEALEVEHHKLVETTGRSKTTTTTEEATPSPTTGQTQRDKSSAGVAMLAAKCATVAVTLILESAFTSPVYTDVDEGHVTGPFPQLGPLAGSLASLVNRFRDSCCGNCGAGVALAEHALVRGSVGDLRWLLQQQRTEDGEALDRRIEQLKQKSIALKEGVEAFDAAVDDMFDEMIKGRNHLLGIFRDEAVL